MKSVRFALFVLLLLSCWRCQTTHTGPYKTRNYVRVGKRMTRVQPPYVIDLRHRTKRLVFVGCDHNRDSTHRQFATIERYFTDLNPQITFNEGGQIRESLHFASRNEAAAADGETGVLKYLSDRAGIRLMNGDLTDSLEFSVTLRQHNKDELFLYYVMERLVIPYLSGAYGKRSFADLYATAIPRWFVQPGFPLAENERSLAYFEGLYQRYMGRPFVLSLNEDIEKFDYINGGDCRFCAIGRTSKMTRDSVLLTKIDRALDQYDRVMVTFGHGHALALEPALKQLLRKKGN